MRRLGCGGRVHCEYTYPFALGLWGWCAVFFKVMSRVNLKIWTIERAIVWSAANIRNLQVLEALFDRCAALGLGRIG